MNKSNRNQNDLSAFWNLYNKLVDKETYGARETETQSMPQMEVGKRVRSLYGLEDEFPKRLLGAQDVQAVV